MQKVALITGAHGSIGQYVAETLKAQGWKTHGIGHGQWKAEQLARVGLDHWHEADVRLESLKATAIKPSLIVHCAGSGSVGDSITNPYLDFQRTVDTTAAVLEFLRSQCPAAALVYPSSAAVYGIAHEFPMSENSPLRPTSPYGAHKIAAENLVREHARLFGLNVAIVRLFSIYGEGFRKQLLWDACQRISAGDDEFFGTGRETRDWLHASDAAALIVRAGAHASAQCPTVNGGSGVAVPIADIVARLFEMMGRRDRPRFCGAVRPGDPSDYQADIRQAMSWDWLPQIALEEGLLRYISWFRQEYGIA